MKINRFFYPCIGALFSVNALADCSVHDDLGTPKADQLLCHGGYLTGYSNVNKSPAWVAYYFTRKNVYARLPAIQHLYRSDDSIPPEFRTYSNDYTDTGYDRGQLAPSSVSSFMNDAAQETFLMSNIVPQLPSFNRDSYPHAGAWAALEEMEQQQVLRRGDINVIAGPVYTKPVQYMNKGIPIPSHFFKVLYSPKLLAVAAFLVPHSGSSGEPISSYLTSVDCVESLTGLDLLSALPDDIENDIENKRAISLKYWSMRDGYSKPTISCKFK